ncbi:MAG: aldo/keto reductase [Polyangia bacterium]|nr:aldo/keto reductase [Polyangia bacterium]
MNRRPLGNSGLEIPPITFGAWAIGGWYWGGSDDAAALGAIERAVDLGVTAVDTAPMYGFGHSEELVGRALRALGSRRRELLLATKCGLRWGSEEGTFFFKTRDARGRPTPVHRNLRPASVRAECEASLRRLGADEIDLYQLHWPDPSTPLADTAEVLARLLEEGKIRAVGASNFDAPLLEELMSLIPVASLQPRLSLLDRSIEPELLPFCRERGLAVLAYSPLAQGILTGAVAPERTYPPGDYRPNQPMFSPEFLARLQGPLEELRALARRLGATPAQVAIAWVLGAPGITSALVGARSAAQVEENAGAAALELAEADRERLGAIFAEVGPPAPLPGS